MAQLLNSRSLTERPRDAAEAAAGQADLVDAAARAGMALALEPGREGTFLEATGALDEAKAALDDLWRMGFSGYMAKTDSLEAEDELSRYHREVVWDVALVERVRAGARRCFCRVPVGTG